jgi:hypothetical protein
MESLLSFSPWIAYGALSAAASWRVGVIAAALVQAALAAALARRRQLDVLEVGTLAFFASMSVLALAAPHSSIHRWLAAISAGALAAIAITSLLVRRPFTLAIARRTTPEALWEHAEFLRINRFITAVWASAFTASAVACALVIDFVRNDAAPIALANAAALLAASYVTRRTIRSARARAAAAGLV